MLVEVNPGEFRCWKVCQIDPDSEYTKFVSCVIDDPAYQVEYEINHWVRPINPRIGDYGLLAFSNFRAAKSWCDRTMDQVVFESLGRYRKDTRKLKKLSVIYSGYSSDGRTLITTVGSEVDDKWPRATVMFGEIKLLERVWG